MKKTLFTLTVSSVINSLAIIIISFTMMHDCNAENLAYNHTMSITSKCRYTTVMTLHGRLGLTPITKALQRPGIGGSSTSFGQEPLFIERIDFSLPGKTCSINYNLTYVKSLMSLNISSDRCIVSNCHSALKVIPR